MANVTVLMAVYEAPLHMLQEAVGSILQQTFSAFEFLIVDDGSHNRALLNYLAKIESSDQRIRVVHESHRGLTRSLNRGIELARGDWIARQDADDWSAPHRLERQVAFLTSHPTTRLCGTNAWTHQQSGRPLWHTDVPGTHAEIVASFPTRNPFVHGTTVFSRKSATAIGGYREAFRCAQDYDFFWRLAEVGQAVNLEERLYHYRYTAGSISACRATEQTIVCLATRELAQRRAQKAGPNPNHRKVETSADIQAAVDSARRQINDKFRGVLNGQLKQADHLLLAGHYWKALQAYLHLISLHPASGMVWAKLARWGIFLAVPPMREACFR